VFAKITLTLCFALALATAGPARADAYLTPIKVGAGPLAHTLQEIARQSGAELLFDHTVVAGLHTPPIDGKMTPLAAVQRALAGASLTVRRAASGALIVEAAAPAPLAQQDVAVSELLVIGHRTQNFDIRRQETDIQPYRVFTGEQIVAAHVDNLGEYFDERVPANTYIQPGGATSQIDLRGLRPEQTLVLVDGRRMPDFPATQFGFQQPDLNALSLHAIDRVETLTGTAGGLYGFGALGGVVNVVLAHDRPGAEAYVTSGISSRGDAARVAFEGRIEFSPDRGATDIMLDVGYTRSQPFTVGQRDYELRDAQALYRVDPTDFLGGFPNGNSIGVFNAFGVSEPLTFKPEYGGATLSSGYTLLPTGFEGSPQALVAALSSHAGQIDFSTPAATAASDLVATPTTGSVLMNVRHNFGGGVEAYFDGIVLWNHSRTVGYGGRTVALLTPDMPEDPFEQYLFLSFPTPLTVDRHDIDADNSRFTAGLLAPLSHDWRATAELTWGQARYSQYISSQYFFGAPDGANPLGSWTAFQRAVAPGMQSSTVQLASDTHYSEQSLRLAGPVFRMPGGPATVTLLAERRREAVPSYVETSGGSFGVTTDTVPPRSTTTTSLYAELRSRIFADAAPSPLLRQLEIQLAARGERESDNFSTLVTDITSPRVHVVFAGMFYTVGVKVSPLPWLMVRASYATGQLPPSPNDLLGEVTTSTFLEDPQRGGFSFSPFVDKFGGSPNLKSVQANTVSAGVVLAPLGPHSLRASFDYSRIKRSNDVLDLDTDTVLAHEDYWPQRVQRGPLTDEDRALGYTAGPVTMIDTTAMNAASYEVQTLDMRFDWPINLAKGQLRLYGAATYTFNVESRGLFQPNLEFSGYMGGPLAWRANIGADWSFGASTLSANVHYYSGYLVDNPRMSDFVNQIAQAYQGSDHTPAQAYLDLRVSRRFRPRDSDHVLKVDIGVSNVLDTPPPRVNLQAGGTGGISPYGDPRRRRFEVTLGALF
jgi:outer membrane receptor protein involved in Fe transport